MKKQLSEYVKQLQAGAQEKTAALKNLTAKTAFMVSVVIAAASCTPEDEPQQPTNPTPTNNTPITNVIINPIDENTPIGTVVGNITATDIDADPLTYTLTNGADKFELDGTNIKTKVDFDFEDGNNTHNLTVQVSDGTATVNATATATETDQDEFVSFVDRPDVTYTKSAALGGATVTEDLSHLDAADTRNAERLMDMADNDPNNQTLQNQLRVADDANGDEVWVDKQTQINEVLNTGLGDATGLNLANTYSNGFMGIDNFRVLTPTESAANNDAVLENQHGEIVHGYAYSKAVQVLKDDWNVTNNIIFNQPSNFTGNDQILARQTRVYLVLLGQNMQKTGSNIEANILDAAAKSKAMVEAMTPSELSDFILDKIYGGNVAAFTSFWGS